MPPDQSGSPEHDNATGQASTESRLGRNAIQLPRDPGKVPIISNQTDPDLTLTTLFERLKDDPQVVKALRVLLKNSSNPRVRARIAVKLGEIKDRDAIPLLLDIIGTDHGDMGFRYAVREALEGLIDTTHLSLLENLLRHHADEVRVDAVWLIARLPNSGAFRPLSLALRDSVPTVRIAAVEGLCQLGTSASLSPLTFALYDKSPDVRAQVAAFLWMIPDNEVYEMLEVCIADTAHEVRLSAIASLARIPGDEAERLLIQLLRDERADIAAQAALTLGVSKYAGALQPLIYGLKVGPSRVKEAAAIALGEYAEKVIVDPLLNAMRDVDTSVRRVAARVLGHYIAGFTSEYDLQEMLRRPREAPAAIVALGEKFNNGDIYTLLHPFLDNSDQDMAYAASRVLINRAEERVLQAILTLFSQPDTPFAVLQALRDEGDQSVKMLETGLGHHSPHVREASVRILEMIDTPRAWTVLRNRSGP